MLNEYNVRKRSIKINFKIKPLTVCCERCIQDEAVDFKKLELILDRFDLLTFDHFIISLKKFISDGWNIAIEDMDLNKSLLIRTYITEKEEFRNLNNLSFTVFDDVSYNVLHWALKSNHFLFYFKILIRTDPSRCYFHGKDHIIDKTDLEKNLILKITDVFKMYLKKPSIKQCQDIYSIVISNSKSLLVDSVKNAFEDIDL